MSQYCVEALSLGIGAAEDEVRWRDLLCHVPAYSYVEGAHG